MSNNIHILGDTKNVVIADKPIVEVVRGLSLGHLEIPLAKFSKLLFLFGADSI
jgi:hypothetical protein